MAWNGSGVFARVHNWASDKAAAIKITASRMDAEFDNFKAGLENCLTRSGENSPTANLPMNGKKHTGVADATSADQYATKGQLESGALVPGAAKQVRWTSSGTNALVTMEKGTFSRVTSNGEETFTVTFAAITMPDTNYHVSLTQEDRAATDWFDAGYVHNKTTSSFQFTFFRGTVGPFFQTTLKGTWFAIG